MTSKQIIDDVDVSECEFYRYSGNHGELTHYCTYQKDEDGLDTHCNADFNKNCFYKEILRKLKHKEKECKKPKKQIKKLKAELKNTAIQKIDWDELIKEYEQFRYSQLSLKEQQNKQSEFYESVLKDIECMLNSYSDTEELIKELKHLLYIVLHERN